MRNIANPRIKFFDLGDALLSKMGFFWSNLSISSSKIHWKRFSKLNYKFAMTLFYDQIRQNLPANVEQSVPSHNPFIACSSMSFVASFFKCCRTSASKRLLKPIKKSFIGICNFKDASIMAVFVSITWLILKLTGMETSFAINNSSEICEMQWIVNFRFIVISMFMIYVIELHKSPLYKFTI